MRTVLDTNVLLQSLRKESPFRPILDAIRFQRIELVVSTAILLEYEEIISRKTSAQVAENVLLLLLGPAQARRQNIFYAFELIAADPDDNKFVDVYLASNADYLVSNDWHFDALSGIGFPKVRIVSAEAFLDVLNGA